MSAKQQAALLAGGETREHIEDELADVFFFVLRFAQMLGIDLGRALNGAGDSMSPMIITILSLWGLQVPLAVFLSRIWQPPTQGIWWAIVTAFVVQGLLVAGWFETGRWKHRKV